MASAFACVSGLNWNAAGGSPGIPTPSGSDRLADGRIDERRQLDSAPGTCDAGEIAEEGSVDSLPALMGGDARELQQLVDVRLREVERRRILTSCLGEAIPRL